MEDLSGKQLGKYQVVEAFGEGGMAKVYKGYQPSMDRNVALKILPRHLANDPAFLTRFEREAKMVAKMQHPHILPVFDYGEDDLNTFLVMPFVQTGTLADELKTGMPPLDRVAEVVGQVCSALAYAHARGIIHRDIKPTNVLIDESANCLLTDFGIAKMVEATVQLTQAGTAIGTPAYMSPEQIEGEELDPRSDIYSLGIVLYEMVTGRPPYRAETPPAIFLKHLNAALPMPREFNTKLPEAVQRVVLKALAKDRQDRFKTADEMAEALQAAIAGAAVLEVEPPVAPTPSTTLVDEEPEEAAEERRTGCLRWAALPLVGVGLLAVAAVAGLALFVVPRLLDAQPPTPLPAVQPVSATETSGAASQVEASPTSAEAAAATPTVGVGSLREASTDGMSVLFVPAGEFPMGAAGTDPEAGPAEVPQSRLMLAEFWIDRTEVSNQMYRRCVQDGACRPPTDPVAYDDPMRTDHPVAWVSWSMASDYCTWAGRRLPTEAQWEKAAAGLEGTRYPWGQALPQGHLLNMADGNLDETWADPLIDDGFEYSAPVGSYPAGASPVGALDMAGNLWEWTADWYDPGWYLNRPQGQASGPPGSPTGTRTVRGGSFLSAARNVRTTYRYGYAPGTSAADLGFRCVADEVP